MLDWGKGRHTMKLCAEKRKVRRVKDRLNHPGSELDK